MILMETKTFRTNLNCENCVETVTPFLKSIGRLKSFSVETKDPRKLLSVTGDRVRREEVSAALEASGFKLYEEVIRSENANLGSTLDSTFTASLSLSSLRTVDFKIYFPLLLILMYLMGFVAIDSYRASDWSAQTLMSHFMGGFFVVFSFFKILDLRGFARGYSEYDIVAKKVFAYGLIYPFIELGLGMAYLALQNLFYTNLITTIVMGVSSAGVIRTLSQKKAIRCACLGTAFQLPMSTVTLVEDALMLAMAGGMLISK